MASPTQLRILLFSLPTDLILLQILLLPPLTSSASSHYTIPTVSYSPTSPLPLHAQALAAVQTLLGRPSATLLPVDLFRDGEKLTDSLEPFTITVEGEETVAWWVGLVPPEQKDEGAEVSRGEWSGRPETVRRVGDGEIGNIVKRGVGLVRAKTDPFYL